MSKPTKLHVRFEVPEELAKAGYEALKIAHESGKVRIGTNETTKSIERGLAKLVVIADDVEPPEIVAHLPLLCDERKVPFIYVPSKRELGTSAGIDVASASACIIDPGEGAELLKEILARLKKVRETA
ncbi:MAG: 50S ribosomal protein L7Ae [Candidatus Bathyarchaeia archaeon]